MDVSTEYKVQVVIRTSAGAFRSNVISFKTHSLDNLTGICVSFGALSGGPGELDSLIALLSRGPKYEKALEWNIRPCRQNFSRRSGATRLSLDK
ncbi:hypothetical protein DFJ73DRAFT_873343 [Zopfochytrium polystomum]|nr:hypothetical protein DFJ73DRAFT_873343 [Zopfochytrium polystomum]